MVFRHVPYAPSDAASVMYANELVAGRSHVKVWLFLVDEKRVRHPNVFDKLRADLKNLNARSFFERQSRICPELPEVKIQREVLRSLVKKEKFI